MFLNKFPYRLAISHIFNKKRFLNSEKANQNLKTLSEDGYVHLKKFISNETLNVFKRYLEFDNYDFIHQRKKVDFQELSEIFKELESKGVINIIKRYLGKNIYCYDNTILTLGKKTSKESAWQPHHDAKGRRIKIYVWLSKYSDNTHPLFYTKGSNNKFMHFKKKHSNLFPELSINKMDKIYGDVGDLIIFDTNGIHSNFKDTFVPRSVIDLTFENFGLFSRVNDKSKFGKNEINRLSATHLKEFLR